MHDTRSRPLRERVVLAGVMLAGTDRVLFEQDMQEMVMLCDTAGVEVVGREVQRRPAPVASTYIGEGKLAQIKQLMAQRESGTLILDAELSPAQVRNIEEAIEGKVIDRSQLILDIFARRASTNEARIQVELAQMRTLYPRLTRAWSHFSRQYAGVGTKGPGEKQLEVDRRLVKKRISDLSRRLEEVERDRATQRKSRQHATRSVVLVGYTNVGKSSLVNALCRADLLVENKLFATLDTATRRMHLPQAGNVTLTDTVGFLRKLPHHLVASFRSTLEVVLDTDLLLIVVDATSPWIAAQLDTVNATLGQLGAAGQRRLLVFNKADLLTDAFARKRLAVEHPGTLFVSARTAEGLPALKEQLAAALADAGATPALEAVIAQRREPVEDPLPGPPS